MNKSEAYDLIIKEYIGQLELNFVGCDGCISEHYCIKKHLREDRLPQPDCPEKLKSYLRQRR